VLVAVSGFGSLWRNRLGNVNESGRVTHAVYYNTTVVVVNGNVRQRPKICGYARFDVIGGFDPNHPCELSTECSNALSHQCGWDVTSCFSDGC
jgi:hypothetical protein